MKIITIGNTLGDLDVINKHIEHSGADYVLCAGDVGIFPKEHKVPKFFVENNFHKYLSGEKRFIKPVYAVRGAHDNIAFYLDVVRHENWIKNFRMIPDGRVCILDEDKPNSLGFMHVSIGGVGGTYSPRVFNAGDELTYKDKRHFRKVDFDRLGQENLHILLMHDVVGGCNTKDIKFTDDMSRFMITSNPLYCMIGKTGWWAQSEIMNTKFVSLPHAKDGYLLIDTDNEWSATGVRFDF